MPFFPPLIYAQSILFGEILCHGPHNSSAVDNFRLAAFLLLRITFNSGTEFTIYKEYRKKEGLPYKSWILTVWLMDKSDHFASECEILWGVILTGRITGLLLTLKVFLNVLLFPSRLTCLQDIRPPDVSPRTWRMRISLTWRGTGDWGWQRLLLLLISGLH